MLSFEKVEKKIPFLDASKGDILIDITYIISSYTRDINLVEEVLYEIPTDIKVKLNHKVMFNSLYLGGVPIRCQGSFIFARGCFWTVELEEHIVLLKMKRRYFLLEDDIRDVLIRISLNN